MSISSILREPTPARFRQQFIADSQLVELRHGEGATMMRALGLGPDIAMTAAAYERAIYSSREFLPYGQNKSGRLWNVLWTLCVALKGVPEEATVLPLQLWVSQVEGPCLKTVLLALKAVRESDNDGGTIITVMLPAEYEAARCPPRNSRDV